VSGERAGRQHGRPRLEAYELIEIVEIGKQGPLHVLNTINVGAAAQP
jgi:hypothetical protein